MKRPSSKANRSHRRGLSTLALVIVMALVLALIGLVIDRTLVDARVQQLEVATEAASLAAAGELHRCGRGRIAGKPKRIITPANYKQNEDAERTTSYPSVRGAAIRIATLNQFETSGLELETNVPNHAHGDVVIGFFNPNNGRFIPTEGNQANAVRVQVLKTRDNGEPLSLWFARHFGYFGADRYVRNTAYVDQRIYGFRALEDVPVPMLPICYEGKLKDLALGGRPIAIRMSDDPGRGKSEDGDDDGDDDDDDDDDEGDEDGDEDSKIRRPRWRLISTKQNQINRILERGFSRADFWNRNRLIKIGESLPLSQWSTSFYFRNSRHLKRLIGKRRIIPIVNKTENNRPQIIAFAAVKILRINNERGVGNLIVQPCRLVTSTALTGKNPYTNPWIGKVVLVNESL